MAGKNINNLTYADDTTLLAQSKEEIKSILMKVKEEHKSWFKLNVLKTKIMASSAITSWQIAGETMESVTDFIFLGFPYGSAGKEPACNAGDPGLIPGLGRSPGEGKGYPLQYSGLENSV